MFFTDRSAVKKIRSAKLRKFVLRQFRKKLHEQKLAIRTVQLECAKIGYHKNASIINKLANKVHGIFTNSWVSLQCKSRVVF